MRKREREREREREGEAEAEAQGGRKRREGRKKVATAWKGMDAERVEEKMWREC